jgi:hypothetical protein
MGLDAVEIILRTEELFLITIGDDEAGTVRTVGEFYNLICAKLNLNPLHSPVTSAKLPKITQKEKKFLFLYENTPLPAPPEVLPWSPQSVWDSVVAVFVDQQGLDPVEILYHARIVRKTSASIEAKPTYAEIKRSKPNLPKSRLFGKFDAAT